MTAGVHHHIRKPHWLKRQLPQGPEFEQIRGLLRQKKLHTVCQEARCPNMWECFSCKTATFLIMGAHCSRNCRFCAVEHGIPEPLDPDEPRRVAEAVRQMGLRYVVITSVTRDDLSDGGASQFAAVIQALRNGADNARIEVLIPDFQGCRHALKTVLDAAPDVLNHNIETVARLYPVARPQADYRQSLTLLRRVADHANDIDVKSGLMVGLGETEPELMQTFADLRDAGCRILTIGQYLQPSRSHLPVASFIPPEIFEKWREIGLNMGFAEVASAPFVRSSYQARHLYEAVDRCLCPSSRADSDTRS